MEITINKEEFKYALSEFGKGEIFEEFAHSFLSQVIGDEFIPVGGTKDKGIDGSLRLYSRSTYPTFIYQISTELGYERKVQNSIEKLMKNEVKTERLIYVTGIQDVFDTRYNVNCYMRSDFLFNYIAMATKKKEIDNMFKEVFPSLLGINLSYHMPKDICGHVNKALNEHSEKSPTMIRRAIRNYTERLMSTKSKNIKKLNSFFDEEIKKLLKS